MRAAARVIAAALSLGLVGSPSVPAERSAHAGPAPTTVDAGLRAELAATAPGQLLSVVARLVAQTDPATIHAPTADLRHAAVVSALRAQAATTQADLLGLLAARRAQGLVAAVDPLWIFNGIAITAVPSVILELAARPEVESLLPDRILQMPALRTGVPSLRDLPDAAAPEPNIALAGAPRLWELGLRGRGIVVANVDTGVDLSHPDLAGRWRGGTNSWYDPSGEHPLNPTDVNGHGTSTMGVMVGGDAGGTTVGMAPDATWIAAKAFDDRGIATSRSIHRSLQWLLDPDGDPATADAPDVVDNSWTMLSSGCDLEFRLDLANLRAAGILPVFSAGNHGPLPGTMPSPANNPDAFAVGATDEADAVDPASSRGPSPCGPAVAPSLAAPGVNVRTTDLYGQYRTVSGTSIAAPHVAGALALLLDAFPDLPADRQAAALEAGAADVGPAGADPATGYGRLDVLMAYQWLCSSGGQGGRGRMTGVCAVP
ncbi:S8 family serine peptidase [Catellatospora tritici]|uniref:S8 family serine peptidase n=1 Tax=Catellatospora tritici TaxID=2851566 RepID=UPI001C2D2614|nr:S8 family serine peptidase [Catellatospora tritici]MBV1853891.1 S8 family serine peptidase [Catellatospora tritici]